MPKQTLMMGKLQRHAILAFEKDYHADFSYDVEDEETLEVTTETATMDDLNAAADLNLQMANRIRQIMAFGFRVFRF